MKRVVISLITLVCYFQAYSQAFIPFDAHSPNATELGSYGFMPVSCYTGRANVSIPIFSTEQRGVPMSITLDYNTSGIPANGLPGWTGVGIYRGDCIYLIEEYFPVVSEKTRI